MFDYYGVVNTQGDRATICPPAAMAETFRHVGIASMYSGPVGDQVCVGSALASSKTLIVALEGQIYNEGELCSALGGLPVGTSSADLVLACWNKWGADCVDRLIGEFAVAVYDDTSESLFLSCDVSQQRSLFYTVRRGGNIEFATAASVLTDCKERFDKTVLANLIGNREIGSRSPFAGVNRVRAGQVVQFRRGAVTKHIYWQPSLVEKPDHRGAAGVEVWRDLIATAVGDRLGASNVIATQLSSGYDSGAVTATAALLVDPARIHAFTSAPIGPVLKDAGRHRFADESTLASLAARKLGIHHHIVREQGSLARAWRQANLLEEFPVWLPVNQGWWQSIREEAAALGATTLLCGERGNDSVNAPGIPMLAEFVRRGQWAHWLGEAKALHRNGLASWKGIFFNSFGARLNRRAWEWLRDRYATKGNSSFRFLHPDLIECLEPPEDPRPSQSPYENRRDYILDCDFGGQRRAGVMQCGILETDPLADRRLLEFSLTLPPDAFILHGRLRPLARAALSDRLPVEVLDVHCRGLQGTDWPYRLTKDVAADVVREIRTSPTNQGLLNFDEIDRVIAGWPDDVEEIYRRKILYEVQLVRALSVGLFVSIFE